MSSQIQFYVNNAVVPFEEDAYHEFKAHKNIAVEELPPWVFDKERNGGKQSRQAVSRALNGFINTGRGGTIYLGVSDDGKVKGCHLSQTNKDHLIASLDDTFGRWTPPVEFHRYKVRFVPVIEQNFTDDEITSISEFDSTKGISFEVRERPHLLRSHQYCWCDKDVVAQTNAGIICPKYVVEIIIKPWNPADKRNADLVPGALKLHPIHEDEEGSVFFRRQASQVTYTVQEITQMSRQEAKQLLEDEIIRLRKELNDLRRAVGYI